MNTYANRYWRKNGTNNTQTNLQEPPLLKSTFFGVYDWGWDLPDKFKHVATTQIILVYILSIFIMILIIGNEISIFREKVCYIAKGNVQKNCVINNFFKAEIVIFLQGKGLKLASVLIFLLIFALFCQAKYKFNVYNKEEVNCDKFIYW